MTAADRLVAPVGSAMERRCHTCGAKVAGKRCKDCGSALAPRTEIGLLAGVNTNFGTVQNVYNMAAPSEPEVVDLRDIQDELNARFPERIPVVVAPAPTAQQERLLPPGPSRTGPSRAVRTLNVMSYVWGTFLIVCFSSLFWYLLS